MSEERPMPERPDDCARADELVAAWTLGAVDPEEAAFVDAHLADCPQVHAEARSLIGAGDLLALAQEPVTPRPELREQVMVSIAATPQDHRAGAARPAQAGDRGTVRRGWLDWLSPRVARPLAVAGVVAAVALGAWGLSLQADLQRTDTALRRVAEAISGGQAAFRVEGSAGRGYVTDTPGSGAALVVTDLAALPADKLYELWLLDAAGTPVAVGTFTPTGEDVLVVEIEQDLANFALFAVTIESERLPAPSSLDLVMVGELAS